MPPAARLGDVHACPACTPTPHLGGPVTAGATSVVIGGLPAARVGDQAACPNAPDLVVNGSPTVFIGGKPAARVGDALTHGGIIAVGCPTVFIGNVPGSFPREGAPPGTDDGVDRPLPEEPTPNEPKKPSPDDPAAKKADALAAAAAKKKEAENNLTFATFLGAPASMELIRAVLGIATALLADLGKMMAPGARAFLAAAVESARQTLALKQFAFLTEQLANVQHAMQDAVATIPPDQLKESAAKAAAGQTESDAAAATADGAATSGTAEPARPKLVVMERPHGRSLPDER
jgi:uncharacterized Zn-binding protein involved in type VI secretion